MTDAGSAIEADQALITRDWAEAQREGAPASPRARSADM